MVIYSTVACNTHMVGFIFPNLFVIVKGRLYLLEALWMLQGLEARVPPEVLR